jgi:phage gp36-like protein
MSVTPYCTQSDVETILSSQGVTARVDDDDNGANDTGIVTACIEQASVTLNRYLLSRYDVATVSACSWAKWACAYCAAVYVMARRGLPVAESIQAEWKEFTETLESIRKGAQEMIGDTGPAAPRNTLGPRVSNLVIDGRYKRQKIRVTPSNSVDGSVSSAQQHNIVDDGNNWRP